MHSHDPEVPLPGEPSASIPVGEVVAARAVLEQDRQARMQACADEIQAVLDRHGMRLDVTPAQVALVPRE
jgi:hypothetical protein